MVVNMKYLLTITVVSALAVLVCGFVLDNDDKDYDLAIVLYEYKDSDGIHTGYKIGKGSLTPDEVDAFIERMANTLREAAGNNKQKRMD